MPVVLAHYPPLLDFALSLAYLILLQGWFRSHITQGGQERILWWQSRGAVISSPVATSAPQRRSMLKPSPKCLPCLRPTASKLQPPPEGDTAHPQKFIALINKAIQAFPLHLVVWVLTCILACKAAECEAEWGCYIPLPGLMLHAFPRF